MRVGTPTGGDGGIRTPDLLHAKQALSQLSYTPGYSIILSQHFSKVKYLNRKIRAYFFEPAR